MSKFIENYHQAPAIKKEWTFPAICHLASKVLMVIWSIFCAVSGLVSFGFVGLTSSSIAGNTAAAGHLGASTAATGAAVAFGGIAGLITLITWISIWIVPMIGLLIIAYLTRPQAWKEEVQP